MYHRQYPAYASILHLSLSANQQQSRVLSFTRLHYTYLRRHSLGGLTSQSGGRSIYQTIIVRARVLRWASALYSIA